MTPPVLVELTRAGASESLHRGWIAVARGDGSLVTHVGDPERLTFARSAMKPFQAIPVVERGAVDRFGFGDAELSICCGSHKGEQRHRDTVRGMLERIGQPATALLGAIDTPWTFTQMKLAETGGETEQRLGQNCSGKHAGMIATCVASGYPLDTYDELDHPHQENIRTIVSRFWEVPEDGLIAGRDNCTLPAYAAPIRAISTGWAKIAEPSHAPEQHRSAITRVADAMGREPFMVAGTDTLNTILMEVTDGRILAKDGAEGVLCMAVRDKGLGITFKIEDGSFRSHGVIALRLLAELDALSTVEHNQLSKEFEESITSNRDHHVGDMRAVFELEWR